MIIVQRPQGQKDESKRGEERRAGLECKNRTRKTGRSQAGQRAHPGGAPSTPGKAAVTREQLYTWGDQLLFLETLISFHSFSASQAGNLEEGECEVPGPPGSRSPRSALGKGPLTELWPMLAAAVSACCKAWLFLSAPGWGGPSDHSQVSR